MLEVIEYIPLTDYGITDNICSDALLETDAVCFGGYGDC